MIRSELRETILLLLLLRPQRSRDLLSDTRLQGVSPGAIREALSKLHHYHALINRDEYGFYHIIDTCNAIRAIGNINKYNDMLIDNEKEQLIRIVMNCHGVNDNSKCIMTFNISKQSSSMINNIISRGLSLAESILERGLDDAEEELLGTLLYHYAKTGQKWLDPRELDDERAKYLRSTGRRVVVVTPVDKLVAAARRLHGYGITYVYHKSYTQKIGLLKRFTAKIMLEAEAR